MRIQKTNVPRQFFEASGPRDRFSKKKPVFRYGLGECVYQISGLYRFRCGQNAWHRQTEKQGHIYTSELKKTHSRGF